MKKKNIFVIIGIIGLVGIFSWVFLSSLNQDLASTNSNECVEESLFEAAIQNSDSKNLYSNAKSNLHLDKNGFISYLYDNFDDYSENQRILDDFENPDLWTVDGRGSQLSLSNEYYGGFGASSFLVSPPKNNLLLEKKLEPIQNLTRWNESGFITMWLKAEEPAGIDSVEITLEDENGKTREYQPLSNVHPSSENTFGNDKELPDLVYPIGDNQTERWTDFILSSGWNYLLWRVDDFRENGFDISKVQKIYLKIQFNENLLKQTLIFDDLRIQDGLQKTTNPTHGMWFPPHGRPQYGVYDIDQNQNNPDDYDLRLLNVRNSQYITNGDHARMISSNPVPVDFAAKVGFTFLQLGPPDEETKLSVPFGNWIPADLLRHTMSGQRNNTYFRVVYDFEPDWDPGHEGFGAYLSLQYNKFGLFAVWPIVRNVQQDQEPKQGDPLATNKFTPSENTPYQLDLVVRGQQASATIYEVKDGCLATQTSVGYTFDHQRHGLDKRYPLSIESTGSVRTIIREVELVSLDGNS